MRPRHLQVLGAAALLLIPLFAYLHFIRWDPEVAFLPADRDTPWITFPYPITPSVRAGDVADPEVFTFTRRFLVAAVPAEATLELRAFRRFSVALNGHTIDVAADPDRWRTPVRAAVADRLVAGLNELHVSVWNPVGPPVLQLALEGDGLAVESNSTFSVTAPDRGVFHARTASDTRPVPDAMKTETPGPLFAKHAAVIGGAFVISVLLALFAAPRASPALVARAPVFLASGLSLFWGFLYLSTFAGLPPYAGFDVGGHLAYLEFVRREHTLPLASDGFEMFHPPLFYLLTGGLASLFRVSTEAAEALAFYRVIPALAGIGNVWATFFLSRALFAGDALRTSLAVGFVGLLPMNLYMSAYVSNESTSALWSNLASLATVLLLLARGAPPRLLAALVVAIGLAMLTKYTIILIVPVMLFFLACKLHFVDGRRLVASAGTAIGVAVGIALVAGWFYVRNVVLYGEPVYVNWEIADGRLWWHLPGFHTAAFFTSFGEVLRHPYFAGFHSYWDGVYSTFWGDGLIGGRAGISGRHDGWNYDYMTLGYVLALPATLLIGVGVLRAFALSFLQDDRKRRIAWAFLLTTIWTTIASQLALGIRYPSYAASKAFYLLIVAAPLGTVAALGLAAIPEWLGGDRLRLVRPLYFGWLGATAAVFGLAFVG